jgi:hypothetical protein
MLVDYNPSFLSGYRSSEYNIEMQECYNSAKEYMKSIIYRDVLWDIGGDEQRVYSIDSNFSNEAFEVTMLPIWMSSFNYKGKDYHITINGVNGEIAGQRPYSYLKIFGLVFAIMLVVAGLFYLDQNYDIFDRGVDIETNINQRYYIP